MPNTNDPKKPIAFSKHPAYEPCRYLTREWLRENVLVGELAPEWQPRSRSEEDRRDACHRMMLWVDSELPPRPELADEYFEALSARVVRPEIRGRKGKLIANARYFRPDRSPGLDLIDPELGFVPGNIEWRWSKTMYHALLSIARLEAHCVCSTINFWIDCECEHGQAHRF